MPRYFFSCEGSECFTDTVGTELPDDGAARLQAVSNAAEVLMDKPHQFTDRPDWRVFVIDERGRTVFAMKLTSES
jgi:hypothetical protein